MAAGRVDYGDTEEIDTDGLAPRGTTLSLADPKPATPPPLTGDGSRGRVPIGVSDGDFSTPTRRRKVITRPRGLPTLDRAGAPQFTTVGEPPAPEVLAAPLPPAEPSAVDEFLAAPPTPAPELELTPPTREPLSPNPSVTEPIENLEQAAEMRRSALAAERQAAVAAHPPVPSESTLVDDLLDQAAAEMMFAAESVEMARASATPSPGPAQTVSQQDLPGRSAVDDGSPAAAGAPVEERLPVTEVAEHGSSEILMAEDALAEAVEPESELSPLAQTLAHMAATYPPKGSEFLEEIEIADAPLVALSSEVLTQSPPPVPPQRGATPPPLPLGLVHAAAVIPEALAERPRRPKRSTPWFEEVFDEDYLRTLPFMTPEQTLREVDFIEACLAVPPGGQVLDVGCGYGRHAIELVQRGLQVTGLDLSLPLLLRATDESQRRALSVNFVHSDMREIPFERQFDGAYCMLTSFGYFDEESNLKVAEGVARALKPGGRFLLDVVNRDYVVSDLPVRVWWEGEGCVVLEEVDFNFNTSRILTHRSVIFEDGRQLEQEISVRAYSLHELGKLLRQAGFRVREVSGSIPTRGTFFGATSRNLILVAEKRAD